jgi:hypothetical protein
MNLAEKALAIVGLGPRNSADDFALGGAATEPAHTAGEPSAAGRTRRTAASKTLTPAAPEPAVVTAEGEEGLFNPTEPTAFASASEPAPGAANPPVSLTSRNGRAKVMAHPLVKDATVTLTKALKFYREYASSRQVDTRLGAARRTEVIFSELASAAVVPLARTRELQTELARLSAVSRETEDGAMRDIAVRLREVVAPVFDTWSEIVSTVIGESLTDIIRREAELFAELGLPRQATAASRELETMLADVRHYHGQFRNAVDQRPQVYGEDGKLYPLEDAGKVTRPGNSIRYHAAPPTGPSITNILSVLEQFGVDLSEVYAAGTDHYAGK